jgi:hypothetical protein
VSRGLGAAALAAGLVAAVVAGAAHPALPDHVVTFDNVAPGKLTSQLRDDGGAGEGVVFGSPLDYGFFFTDTQQSGPDVGQRRVSRFACGAPTVAPSERARSGDRVARIGCGTEFGAYGAFGVLPRWRSKLTVYVQAFDAGFAPATFVLTAYDYQRTPISTRTMTSAAGPTGWQPLTVTSGTPTIAYFAVYLNRAEAGGRVVGIDDVTYDQPSTPPTPQISLSRADGSVPVIVHQGETRAVDFEITRWNGSTGNVELKIEALNPEIDAASFAPNPAGGTTSKLFLHARVDPLFAGDSGGRSGSDFPASRVTATPLAASAGSTTDSHSFPLGVLPIFALRPPSEADLSRCVRTSVSSGLSVAPGFAQPISLAASVRRLDGSPSGIEAVVDPAVYRSGFSSVPEVRLYASAGEPRADGVLVLTASSPGYPTRQAAIRLKHVPPRVEGVFTDSPGSTTVTRVTTEEFLAPPQRVRIRGTGFCTGTVVEFGNQKARSTPDSIAADGRSMRVPVHRLATNGPIAVLLSTGERVVTTNWRDVDTYRARDGFAFPNRAGRGLTWSEFVGLFGWDQTHLPIDLCPFLPGVDCGLTTPMPSPLAGLFWAHVGRPTSGLCFGLSAASLRMREQDPAPSRFGGRGIHDLGDPVDTDTPFNSFLHQMQVLQHSVQMTNFRKRTFASQRALFDALAGELRRHQPVIVGFARPGQKDGHAIVAYDIRERGDDFDILAYDPNNPYRTKEAGSADPSGEEHAAADAASTLHVANGGWSYPGLGWRGSVDGIYVIPSTAVFERPILPQRVAELVVFASGGAAVGQVRSESGAELFGGGRLNRRDFPGVSVLAPLDSREGANPTVLLPTGRRYRVDLRRTRTGKYAAAFVNARVSGFVTGDAGRAGPVTAVTVDTAARSLNVTGGIGPRFATLVVKGPASSFRTVTLRTSAQPAASDTIAIDPARGTVTVRHHGPPGAISVELGWIGKAAPPRAFSSTALRIRPGETLTLTSDRWQSLGAGAGAVRATRTAAGGSRTSVRLPNVARATVSLAGLRLDRRISGRRATLTLRGRLVGLGRRDAVATATVEVRRGGRTIVRLQTPLTGSALARPVSWTTTRLRPGRYTAVAVVAILSGRSGSIARTLTGRSTRVSFTIS